MAGGRGAGHGRATGCLKRCYLEQFRNSYGSEVYDEEVEAYCVETVPDEEERNTATAGSSQSIERTGVVESVW